MQAQQNGLNRQMNLPIPLNLKFGTNNKLLSRNPDTETWVQLCRNMLIDMESKNIKTRAVFWTKFVNDTTKKTMNKMSKILQDHSFDDDYAKFEFQVTEPLKHLRFLAEWT
eukprot:269459_1